eukprot:1161445-Pelagomonas_calceolata.AAC.2
MSQTVAAGATFQPLATAPAAILAAGDAALKACPDLRQQKCTGAPHCCRGERGGGAVPQACKPSQHCRQRHAPEVRHAHHACIVQGAGESA